MQGFFKSVHRDMGPQQPLRHPDADNMLTQQEGTCLPEVPEGTCLPEWYP
jgi:hypothetical protein